MNAPDLEQLIPLGVPASRQWLLAQGMSASRLDNALKSGKLQLLATGLYARKGLPVQWQGVVNALQRELPQVVLGGLTALDVVGRGHYVQRGARQRLDVYAPGAAPRWLSRLHVKAPVRWQWWRTTRLWQAGAGNLSAFHTQEYVWRDDLPPIVVSSAERALLEILLRVPENVSFEMADSITQGLTNLSPARLQELLECCQSVKAKRLFFWFARRHRYGWAQKLDPADFDLGSGKRVVAKQGRLDKALLITVPEAMYESR